MDMEHADDMTAEVSESAGGEADQYSVVAEDDEERDAEAERKRLLEMEKNAAKAEGDDAGEA
jgi:hypothetical protein